MHYLIEAWDSSHLLRLSTDESGQDLSEYAILIGLVALAVIASVMLLGESITSVFEDIGSSMSL